MKKIKVYGLSLALALLLLLAVAPCAQAADMTEGSYYAIGYLYPPGCTLWAYGYNLGSTTYATMVIKSHSWYAGYISFGVLIRYPNGTIAAVDEYGFPAPGPCLNGITVSTSMLNPPIGGYVNFDVCTMIYISVWGEDVYFPLGGDSYNWYYPSGGGGGGGCPFLQVWDGSDYVDEGLLDIHNAEGVDVTYEHALTNVPEPLDGTYVFRLTEHPQTISDIDQVQLHAILEDGTIEELRLKRAWHSEDDNVRNLLLKSDDRRVEEKGADHNGGTSQSIDLEFKALGPNTKAVAFIFTIEGNNMILKT